MLLTSVATSWEGEVVLPRDRLEGVVTEPCHPDFGSRCYSETTILPVNDLPELEPEAPIPDLSSTRYSYSPGARLQSDANCVA